MNFRLRPFGPLQLHSLKSMNFLGIIKLYCRFAAGRVALGRFRRPISINFSVQLISPVLMRENAL